MLQWARGVDPGRPIRPVRCSGPTSKRATPSDRPDNMRRREGYEKTGAGREGEDRGSIGLADVVATVYLRRGGFSRERSPRPGQDIPWSTIQTHLGTAGCTGRC